MIYTMILDFSDRAHMTSCQCQITILSIILIIAKIEGYTCMTKKQQKVYFNIIGAKLEIIVI
jgi:hypothetical protein